MSLSHHEAVGLGKAPAPARKSWRHFTKALPGTWRLFCDESRVGMVGHRVVSGSPSTPMWCLIVGVQSPRSHSGAHDRVNSLLHPFGPFDRSSCHRARDNRSFNCSSARPWPSGQSYSVYSVVVVKRGGSSVSHRTVVIMIMVLPSSRSRSDVHDRVNSLGLLSLRVVERRRPRVRDYSVPSRASAQPSCRGAATASRA